MVTFPFHWDALSNKALSKFFTLEIQKGTYPPNSHILPRILRSRMPGLGRSFHPHPSPPTSPLWLGRSPQGFAEAAPQQHPFARKPPKCRPALPTPPLPPAVPSSPRPAHQSEVRTPEQAWAELRRSREGTRETNLHPAGRGPCPHVEFQPSQRRRHDAQRGVFPHRWAVAGGR